jgi:hypothetical protein
VKILNPHSKSSARSTAISMLPMSRPSTGKSLNVSSTSLLEKILLLLQAVCKLSSSVVMRERIALANDNKHMISFKKCYDRLFKEFKEKLMAEYQQMKTTYLGEYEQNYQANVTDKNAHIEEIRASIG